MALTSAIEFSYFTDGFDHFYHLSMNLFIRNLFLAFLAIFSTAISQGQAPEGINYQAVLRDSDTGEALRNEMVFIIISIRVGGPNGPIAYSESHSGIITSEFGLINLVIGSGDVTEGNFGDIDWATGEVWYEIEVDAGQGLLNLGAVRFLSVPYALFAGNVESNLDNDPANELINSVEFDSETQTIQISEASNQFEVDLEGLQVNDADSDPQNELIDPNEGLQLLGTTLVITEAGISYSANLASLQNDADWQVEEGDNIVFNEEDRIGIGTVDPTARLTVGESTNSSEVLNVTSGEQTMLRSANERIGVGTSNLASRVQFGGSIGYDVTLLSSTEEDSYSASIEDHMIVVNFQEGGNSDFSILLPPAVVCEGRVYLIRKTGAPGEVGDLTISTSGFPVDFDDPDLVLSDNGPQTAVLLSLGSDGWTRILRED
jgi:hypothetical protein